MQTAEQAHNYGDEHDRPNDPQAATGAPSGIPVIAATCAEHQQQDNNE